MSHDHLLSHLHNLPLTRLGAEEPAGLWVTSLPVRPGASVDWMLNGQPTHVKPLGNWPGNPSPGPRRLILAADAGGEAPETIRLAEGNAKPTMGPPTAEMVTFEHADIKGLGTHYWERSFLKISWGGRWIGLAMGMRVKGEVHWWEGCNLVVLSQSETCLEIEMGGAIPRELLSLEDILALEPGKWPIHPHLHKHNWLNGSIYARLHSNGVCEIYAHHINSMFFDDGGDLLDCVPLLGFQCGSEEDLLGQCGVWDGSRHILQLGDIALDLTDTARLATPEKPGRVDIHGDFLVVQPYLGMEMYGGIFVEGRTGDEWCYRAEQQIIPRGFARTLRFSASLNPERPARVARYLAPAWWYGVCEEFLPQPLLPVSNEYDVAVDSARESYHRYMVRNGFEDGLMPNYQADGSTERQMSAAEGDMPGTMFQMSYRTSDPDDYDCAMRSCYALTDIFVDHATNRILMQGYMPPAVALPLQRMQSAIFAWLETGDPYCINTAQAVMDTAYWWHKNSWPRRAVGRDSRFVHSQILLYRYLNDQRSLQRARDIISDLAAVQWEDGSFGDQAGGTGFHSSGAYLAKPWMSWMATFAILDYLEVVPDDPEAEAVVERTVEWLMSEHGERDTADGGKAMGWRYTHAFHGKALPDYTPPEKPTPGGELYHFDYMARLFMWMSEKTGDSRYFEAWAQSHKGRGPERRATYSEGTSVFLLLPWLQARLWNARLTPDGVEIAPRCFGKSTPSTGAIMTPDGPLMLRWSEDGELEIPDGMRCKVVE